MDRLEAARKWKQDRLKAMEVEKAEAQVKREKTDLEIKDWSRPRQPPVPMHREVRVMQTLWSYCGPPLTHEIMELYFPELTVIELKGRVYNGRCLLWLRFRKSQRRQRMHKLVQYYNQFANPEKQIVFDDYDDIVLRKAFATLYTHPFHRLIEAKTEWEWIGPGVRPVQHVKMRFLEYLPRRGDP